MKLRPCLHINDLWKDDRFLGISYGKQCWLNLNSCVKNSDSEMSLMKWQHILLGNSRSPEGLSAPPLTFTFTNTQAVSHSSLAPESISFQRRFSFRIPWM